MRMVYIKLTALAFPSNITINPYFNNNFFTMKTLPDEKSVKSGGAVDRGSAHHQS